MADQAQKGKRTWLWILIPALLWGAVQGIAFSWGRRVWEYSSQQWKNAGQEVVKDFREGAVPDPEVIEAEKDREREEAVAVMLPPLILMILLPLAARAIHKTWSVPLLAVLLGLAYCFANILPITIAWPR